MTERTSCIQHPPNAPLLVIRDEYLVLCEGDHCAAALLAVFEFWHNVKLANAEQAKIDVEIAAKEGVEPKQSAELWIYKSQEELQDDMLGLFGETKIAKATRWLISAGYLATRSNPHYKWDHKAQYLFCTAKVQADMSQKYVSPFRKNTASKAQNHGTRSRKNKATIPETTTETTTEKKSRKRDLLFESVSWAWNNNNWSYVGLLKKFCTGKCTKANGAYFSNQIKPAMTPREIVGLKLWRDHEGLEMPKVPETVKRVVLEFRGIPEYERILQNAEKKLESFGTPTTQPSPAPQPVPATQPADPITVRDTSAVFDALDQKLGGPIHA